MIFKGKRQYSFLSSVSFFSTSSFLKNKLKDLALRRQKEYLDSFKTHGIDYDQQPSHQALYKSQEIKSIFNTPQIIKNRQPSIVNITHDDNDTLLKNLNITPQYKKILREIKFTSFGTISVSHDDIFNQEADCILIPIPSNFMPYKGIGLEALERGGKNLIEEAFAASKSIIQIRFDNIKAMKAEIISKDDSSNAYKKLLDDSKHLMLGDVILTASHNISETITLIAFVVMPYFWQESTTAAAQRLRYTIKSALNYLNTLPISKICLPNLSKGLYGYEPSFSSSILIEESFEALLQVEAEIPQYNINEICFVDSNENCAMELKRSLEELGRAYIPEMQVVPAPVYWSHQDRRLLEISPEVVKFCKKHQKFSFKKYHSIIRRRNTHWFSNLRPYVWRTSRCLEPPPLLVNKQTGEPADLQFGLRPFYYRGVTHFLFPPRNRLNFPAMRVTRNGKFVGVNKLPNISVATKPKL